MEVHKPKPWRGWREFAKEIGTILIGVSLALGAEQGVEWLHHQHEAAETRQALRTELADNAGRAFFLLQEYQCLQKRTDQLARWAAGGAKPTLNVPAYFGDYTFSAWEVAKAGAIVHLPLAERMSYQQFYDFLGMAEGNIVRAKDIASRLSMYASAPVLTPEEATRLREETSAGRTMSNYIMDDERTVLRYAETMRLGRPMLEQGGPETGVDDLCRERVSEAVEASPGAARPRRVDAFVRMASDDRGEEGDHQHAHVGRRLRGAAGHGHHGRTAAPCVAGGGRTGPGGSPARGGQKAAPPARPDILFIPGRRPRQFADLGCYGRRGLKTPNIDRLAAEGMRLTQAYANSAVCSASRTAIITGRYQDRLAVGLREPLTGDPKEMPNLPADRPTLPSYLKAAAYRTALIGKWHLGGGTDGPRKAGYDYFYGFHPGASDYFRRPTAAEAEAKDAVGSALYENETVIRPEGYLTDLGGAGAARQIAEAPSGQSLFLSLHFNATHWPWEGPGDSKKSADLKKLGDTDSGNEATFGAMVERMDEGVGLVLAALERAGRANNTIVIFTSDNGGERVLRHLAAHRHEGRTPGGRHPGAGPGALARTDRRRPDKRPGRHRHGLAADPDRSGRRSGGWALCAGRRGSHAGAIGRGAAASPDALLALQGLRPGRHARSRLEIPDHQRPGAPLQCGRGRA